MILYKPDNLGPKTNLICANILLYEGKYSL